MSLRFVSCQSFAGGFDMGATQAGLALVHKVEQKGGFGLANVEANRHLVGDNWKSQACAVEEWEPVDAEIVIGNPPCSGFSPLSVKTFRGPSSPINSCMWAFVEYTAKIRPYIAIFESVQQAFSGGRDLMQALRTHLEDLTGDQWQLIHVKHNAAGVGGCAIRRRYFWVATRVPFGVEEQPLRGVPKLRDVIGDLENLSMTWGAQPYRRPPAWWVEEQQLRSQHGVVDGHRVDWCPYTRRAIDLLEDDRIEWKPREIISKVARRYYEYNGRLPESWNGSQAKLVSSDFNMGYNQLTRWNPDTMARVITGGALTLVLHPWLDRPLTHREVARIMGFPDDWVIYPLRRVGGLRMTWGKGIAVQCGRWIGQWAKNSIEGNPGSDTGKLIGDREWLIDHTYTYKRHTDET